MEMPARLDGKLGDSRGGLPDQNSGTRHLMAVDMVDRAIVNDPPCLTGLARACRKDSALSQCPHHFLLTPLGATRIATGPIIGKHVGIQVQQIDLAVAIPIEFRKVACIPIHRSIAG